MTITEFFHRFFTRPGKATVRAVVAGGNTLLGLLTIFSAYGGAIDPEVCVLASLMAMALPVFLILGVLLLVLDLCFWKKASLVLIASWAVAIKPILAFAPLNIGGHSLSQEERENSFTFLTYNVLHFWDFRGHSVGLEQNATIDYILDLDADIVSLQEADMLKEWPLWRITRGQIQQLAEQYPFRAVCVDDQFTVLSKYPFVRDRLDVPARWKSKFSFYRLSMKGQVVHLANCHLQSIGLTPDDKTLYRSLVKSEAEITRREVDEVKNTLLRKLQNAFLERRSQAEYLRHVIDSIGGNWIVAGDFNDIPACYAVRTIMDGDMHDAYAEEAFGPTITYHGSMFYFRIDQVLYKGDFQAVDITRGSSPASDHYSLLTTFVFDQDK